MNAFAFANVGMLAALLALPVIWYFLRLMPPKPRVEQFPPTRLLIEIAHKEEQPARSPWWLTALRLALAAAVILALAGPVFKPTGEVAPGTGPLLLVVDNGWAATPAGSRRSPRRTGSSISPGGEPADRAAGDRRAGQSVAPADRRRRHPEAPRRAHPATVDARLCRADTRAFGCGQGNNLRRRCLALRWPRWRGRHRLRYGPHRRYQRADDCLRRRQRRSLRVRSKRAGMMAPLYDVFVATVLEGRSQRAAAKSCDCSPALLSKRVGELEKEFGLPLKQLQNYAQPLLEMETSVKGQRYARKKRGAPQDETGQYEEDDGQTAREDDDGYLREERQDDS